MRSIRISGRLLWSITVGMVLFAFGCLLAVPVAIQYYQSTRDYVATAEVGVDAETVYRAFIREAQARSAKIRIVKRDDAGRLLEISDGVQNASVKAVPLASGKTEIVVVADVPQSAGGKEKEEELALRIIRSVANRLGVKYEITKR